MCVRVLWWKQLQVLWDLRVYCVWKLSVRLSMGSLVFITDLISLISMVTRPMKQIILMNFDKYFDSLIHFYFFKLDCIQHEQ